ncbi:uncharacterized protein LOC109413247 [Aedes albopictus]|uniref:Myb/SANT-like DNA-binding domain-containing protein n=1 Tax=Aedes albopictus TaxID=7160 RepID=A0ABM1YPV0_AEDAL
MEQEQKSRAKKMTAQQIRRLISARVACNHLFTAKYYDKKAAWRKIQQQAELHEFTDEQVKIKWNNLTRKYKILITPPTGGATENGEELAEDWEHFGQMHEFMSTQHTINPPLVVNSCGVIVENSNNIPIELSNQDDGQEMEAGPSGSVEAGPSDGAYVSSPEMIPPTSSPQNSEGYADRGRRKRSRYSQQDMFEFFVKQSKQKKKEGKKFFGLLKRIAESQNVDVADFDSSSSDSDADV